MKTAKANGTMFMETLVRETEAANGLWPGTIEQWIEVGKPRVDLTFLRNLGDSALHLQGHAFIPAQNGKFRHCEVCKGPKSIHPPTQDTETALPEGRN